MEQTQHTIAFHILDCDITQCTKVRLHEYISIYPNASLTFHRCDTAIYKEFPIPAHFSSAMYSRLFIAEIAPHITKAVYIDVDTCVVGDIATLFQHTLDNYGLGAVSGDTDNIHLSPCSWLIKHKDELGMNAEEYYFASGLLLLDCQYWREHNITQRCLEYLHSDCSLFTHPDQDVLNLVFRSHYTSLPFHYHCFANDTSPSYRAYIEEHLQHNGCCVIHYASGKKPWNSSTDEMLFSDIWWHYARLTPWYTEICIESLTRHVEHILRLHMRRYHTPIYKIIFAYIKYKGSIGSMRKKYKAQYKALTSI